MNYQLSIIAAAVALTSASCGGNSREASPVVRTVKVDTVRVADGGQQSVYPAKVRAGADVSVAFRVSGSIERMPVAEGAFVRKGAVVAELDTRDYRVQLSATEAEYNQIKATAERITELYKRGSATKSDYEKATYGLEQIAAKYRNHQNQLADTRLTAPFDGYIRKKIHDTGETVGAGMPVVSMISGGDWQVELSLPVQDYARRNSFERFEAIVATAPDQPLPLELLELSPKGNASQLYNMTLRVKQPCKATLAAGMSVEVVIGYRTGQAVTYKIPLSAMFERDGAPHVWIFKSEDLPAEARRIAVSEVQHDGYLIVEQGVVAGEMVVTAGVHSIKDGERIKPLPAASKTNVGGLL
jgi:RND family efflux transporter MFP subunit